jgi:predicted HNH restriction endonuclease
MFRLWHGRVRNELWGYLSQYADLSVASVSSVTLVDLFAEIEPDSEALSVRTEGGKRAIITNRIERDPSLRDAAIHIHGTRCQVCGFSFEAAYGPWGRGFAIVHHLRMLADDSGTQRVTDPRIDLAVVCANCHCMIHRKRKVVLTLDELSAKLVPMSPNPVRA